MVAIDKVKHFAVGSVLFVVGELFNVFVTHTPYGMIGLGLVVAAAAIKEWLDYLGYGTPEWLDFYATLIGGVAALAIIEPFLPKS